MNPGHHAIFVGLTTGVLSLAFLALTYRVWFRPERPIVADAWQAADAIALYAALIGTLALLFAIASGLMLRPVEAFFNSPITKNKILTSLLATAAWGGFLAIRLKGGEHVWRHPFVAHSAYVFASAGFIFLITTNSIGGDISGIPSGYEEFAQSIGFRTRHAVYFPAAVNAALVLIGIAAVIWAKGRAGTRKTDP